MSMGVILRCFGRCLKIESLVIVTLICGIKALFGAVANGCLSTSRQNRSSGAPWTDRRLPEADPKNLLAGFGLMCRFSIRFELVAQIYRQDKDMFKNGEDEDILIRNAILKRVPEDGGVVAVDALVNSLVGTIEGATEDVCRRVCDAMVADGALVRGGGEPSRSMSSRCRSAE